MAMEFHGLAVSEADSGMVRFTAYETRAGSEAALIVCHVSHKTLAALAKDAHDAPGLMRVFEQHRGVIEAAAAARFARGETSPLVSVRDILLKR